jgi:small redox-active disulfide protein 2
MSTAATNKKRRPFLPTNLYSLLSILFPKEFPMLTIKVLGSGCANCKRVEQIARKVVEEMSLQAEIIKVTDYADIMAYDILSTPGLVINEKLVSAGRIPSEAEITTFLANALEAA